MKAALDSVSKCRKKLISIDCCEITDPTLIRIPDQDKLDVLNQIVSALRTFLKTDSIQKGRTEDSFETLLLLSTALVFRGRKTQRYVEAISTANEAIDEAPTKFQGYLLRGQINILKGLKTPKWMKEAHKDLSRSLLFEPASDLSLYCLALCDLIPARISLEKAHNLRSQGKLRKSHDWITSAEKGLERAVGSLEKLLDRNKNNGLALFQKALCLSYLGQLEESVEDLSRVIKLGQKGMFWLGKRRKEKIAQALCERAEIHANLGRLDKALKDFEKSETLGSDHPLSVRRKHAEVAFRAQCFDKVIEILSAVPNSALNSRDFQTRAHTLYEIGRYDLARADASHLLVLEKNHRYARFLRGLCSYKLQRFQSAISDFDRCLPEVGSDVGEICCFTKSLENTTQTSGQDHPEGLLARATALYILGEKTRAKSDLKQSSVLGCSAAWERLNSWFGSS